MMKKSKIIIEYLYRDAGNYKLFEESVIENPRNLSILEFEEWFKDQLIDNLYFVPQDFGLVKPKFPIDNPELDLDWCEFISFRRKIE